MPFSIHGFPHLYHLEPIDADLTLDESQCSSAFVHPAHLIVPSVLPRIVQVLSLLLLLTLGIRKAALAAATAAADLLRVGMVVNIPFV